MMLYFFGTENLNLNESPKVDKDLKAYLSASIPDALSLNKYIITLSK